MEPIFPQTYCSHTAREHELFDNGEIADGPSGISLVPSRSERFHTSLDPRVCAENEIRRRPVRVQMFAAKQCSWIDGVSPIFHRSSADLEYLFTLGRFRARSLTKRVRQKLLQFQLTVLVKIVFLILVLFAE